MPKLYPIKTTDFIKYLESLGIKFIRTKGSHSCFSRPGLIRPLIIKLKDKQMKGTHVNRYLNELDKTWEDLENFLNK